MAAARSPSRPVCGWRRRSARRSEARRGPCAGRMKSRTSQPTCGPISLFADGKVVAVVESGVFADRTTAATLFEEIRQQLPWSGGAGQLTGKARDAATRLLQVLRLFDVDPAAVGPERAMAALPGGAARRERRRAVAARRKGRTSRSCAPGSCRCSTPATPRVSSGLGDSAASLVADLVRDGLPDRHALILIESAVAPGPSGAGAAHPPRAVAFAGEITAGKGGLRRPAGAGERARARDRSGNRPHRSRGAGEANSRVSRRASARAGRSTRTRRRALPASTASSPRSRAARRSRPPWSNQNSKIAGRRTLSRSSTRSATAGRGSAREAGALPRQRRRPARGAPDVLRQARRVSAAHRRRPRQSPRRCASRAASARYGRFSTQLAPKLQGEVPGLARIRWRA